MIVIALWSGQPTTVVDRVLNDSPAYEAGIQAGDEIVAVNGERTDEWSEVIALIGENESDKIDITVLRDGSELTLSPETEYDEAAAGKR